MMDNRRLKNVCGFQNLSIPEGKSDIKFNGSKINIVNGMFDLRDCK